MSCPYASASTLFGAGRAVMAATQAGMDCGAASNSWRETDFTVISDRRRRGPYGLAGGEAGSPGRNLLTRSGASRPRLLPSKARVALAPGDVVTVETPGGGGWGEA